MTNVRGMELESGWRSRFQRFRNDTEPSLVEPSRVNIDYQLYRNECGRNHRTRPCFRSENGPLQSAQLIYRMGDLPLGYRSDLPGMAERDEREIYPSGFQFYESDLERPCRWRAKRG